MKPSSITEKKKRLKYIKRRLIKSLNIWNVCSPCHCYVIVPDNINCSIRRVKNHSSKSNPHFPAPCCNNVCAELNSWKSMYFQKLHRLSWKLIIILFPFLRNNHLRVPILFILLFFYSLFCLMVQFYVGHIPVWCMRPYLFSFTPCTIPGMIWCCVKPVL